VLAFVLDIQPLGWGRLAKSYLNVQVGPKVGWFLMEVPALLWVLYFVWAKGEADLILLYGMHYVNRSVVYPLRMLSTRPMGIEVVLSALFFNLCNGYLQGLAYLQGYPSSSLQRVLGVALFTAGMLINIDSDERLRLLKKDSQEYKVPTGGCFGFVSAANYFGEIL
jgi:hypothetical protein